MRFPLIAVIYLRDMLQKARGEKLDNFGRKMPKKQSVRTRFGGLPVPRVIIEEISSHMDKDSNDSAEYSEEHPPFRLFCVPSQKCRSRYKKFQSQCYNFLERPCGVLSVTYHLAVFALVVAGLVLAVLETMDDYKDNEDFRFRIYILEMFLLALFGMEYILRMWSAGCRSTYVGFFGRIRFAFKPFVIVDLIVIGSTTIVILRSTLSPRGKLSSAISILRFFQVLRMVRFDRQGGSWKLLGSVLFLHKQELMTTFYIGFCSLIFASFFVYQAEKDVNSAEFGTFADSFWWGVVTLTTVGYGDKIPSSWAGRGVAAFFAIMGISFFALPAGILGSGFALKVSQQQRQKHVKRRRRPAATLIQCNWRYYASRKESKLEATWLPYIKFIQERNTRREEAREMNILPEKTVQNYVRTRKLSIFSRKTSGLNDGAFAMNLGPPDHSRVRRKKSNDMFVSSDSLHDAHSFSALDERHSESGGINLIYDDDGKAGLPISYKRGIRFTRYLKFLVALRKFKLAKKPYDVKDVIEQYSTGHVELLGKVKGISCKIDDALGGTTGKPDDAQANGRTNIVHRLSKLEKQVKNLDSKLDQVISLMEDSRASNSPVNGRLVEEGTLCCCICGHNAAVPKTEGASSQVVDELKMPTRRRKVAIASAGEPTNARSCEQMARKPLPKSISLLTAERVKEAMDGSKNRLKLSRSSSLKAEHIKTVIGEGKNKQQSSETCDELNQKNCINNTNYLSPRSVNSEQYDLRGRSDSAIYSNCSRDKKDDGEHSGITPPSSDSDETSHSAPIVLSEQKHTNSNKEGLEITRDDLPYSVEGEVQETRM